MTRERIQVWQFKDGSAGTLDYVGTIVRRIDLKTYNAPVPTGACTSQKIAPVTILTAMLDGIRYTLTPVTREPDIDWGKHRISLPSTTSLHMGLGFER
jgi:hypothetical protein